MLLPGAIYLSIQSVVDMFVPGAMDEKKEEEEEKKEEAPAEGEQS